MLGNGRRCLVCGTTYNLHRHHIFYGNANRKNSEQYSESCTCWLCIEHHEGASGVHGKYGEHLNKALKEMAQREFEKTHTRDQFVAVFGRSYL